MDRLLSVLTLTNRNSLHFRNQWNVGTAFLQHPGADFVCIRGWDLSEPEPPQTSERDLNRREHNVLHLETGISI
ncbi:unnamed protein product [Moneuplotes crassus]|uniref:Uncharacterized protein n=1 Tax=Euplotes crassus TaxID=5936 RepID=A0AAD2DAG9_EUPCR|nr:unnamed protein product [Moneuplotes crassus]